MKNVMIVLLVIAALMFGGLSGTILGIILQKKIDKAVKQAEIDVKDREINALNDKLVDAVKKEDSLIKVIHTKSAEIDRKDKTIRELQKQATESLFINNPFMEEYINIIKKQVEQNDFSGLEHIVNSLPSIKVRDLIEKTTGITASDMPDDDSEIGAYFINLFRMIYGQTPVTGTVSTISFALRVNTDNSPISPVTVFKIGNRRIYACFPMQGTLAGLSTIIHRWRNKNTGEIMRMETKPITPNATYNWTYLEKKEGWPAGEYAVELFETKTLSLIAQGMFTTLVEEKKEETKEDKPDKPKEPGEPKKGSKVLVEEQFVDVYKLALEGGKLSDDEADNLEKALQGNPDDFASRMKLLGYYFGKQFKSESARKARQKHVLWVIKNHPDYKIAGLPYVNLAPVMDKETYYEAKTLWLKQVEAYKDNVSVLENAANFLLIFDHEIAENLLLKAKELEPENPKWPERLEFLHKLHKDKEKKEEPKEDKSDKSKDH